MVGGSFKGIFSCYILIAFSLQLYSQDTKNQENKAKIIEKFIDGPEPEECGLVGSIEERIQDCSEKVSPYNSVTVSIERINNEITRHVIDLKSKIITGPQITYQELIKVQQLNKGLTSQLGELLAPDYFLAAKFFCESQNKKIPSPLRIKTWRLTTYYEMLKLFNSENKAINKNKNLSVVLPEIKKASYWTSSTDKKAYNWVFVGGTGFFNKVNSFNPYSGAICVSSYP